MIPTGIFERVIPPTLHSIRSLEGRTVDEAPVRTTGYRVYTSLQIVDFRGTPAEISKRVGVDASDSWQEGDPVVPGTDVVRTNNGWMLRSDRAPQDRLDDHVRSIIDRITPNLDALVDLGEGLSIRFCCALYIKRSGAVSLPDLYIDPDALRLLSRLGASIDMSVYVTGM